MIADRARCVELCHLSSGWFKHIEPHRTTSKRMILERARCVGRQYLVSEHRDKKKTELSLEGWRDIDPGDIPLQKNSSDCGFICMYARHLASNTAFTFSQEHMPDIRRHIVGELLEQRILLYIYIFVFVCLMHYIITTPNSRQRPCFLCTEVVREGSRRFAVVEPLGNTHLVTTVKMRFEKVRYSRTTPNSRQRLLHTFLSLH